MNHKPRSSFGYPVRAALFVGRAFLFSLLPVSLSAQYVLKQWNVEHGLPQSTVRCLTQTHDGYLWIGTWNGLARFDGVRMTVFNAANTEKLYPSVMSLHEDTQRRLWIGSDGGGLVRYVNGTFTRFDRTHGIPATRILSISEDTQGRIWFATEIGVFAYVGGRFLHFTMASGLGWNYADQAIGLPNGDVFLRFVGFASIVRMVHDSLLIKSTFPVGGYRAGLDSSGNLWYGIRGQGLIRRTNDIQYVDKSVADIFLTEVYVPRNQQKWVLTTSDVKVVTEAGVQTLKEIDGVSLDGISCVFEDLEGNIWLGKEGGGVLRLRKKQVEMITVQNGLVSNAVTCGLEDRKGNLWIGTWQGGIVRRKSQASSIFVKENPQAPPISITSLCETRDGTLWVGTWGHGLFTLRDGQKKQFVRGAIDASISIVALAEDYDGGLWIATAHNGVAYFKGDVERLWNMDNGLTSNRVSSILPTRDGSLWMGTTGGGINRIKDGQVSILREEDGLIDDFVGVLLEEEDGSVWLTTKRGIQRWRDGVLSTISHQQGLYTDVAQFIGDNDGNYWFGSTHGVSRVSKQNLHAVADGKVPTLQLLTIGKEDGMANEECSGGHNKNVWKTSDGTLWFSTSAGAVRINPRAIASNPVPPDVIIEDALIEHRSVSLEQLVMEPGQTKIEFRYTGISFSAPQKIRFHYMLEGFDDHWKDAGEERLVQFTNLAPGNYRFWVKAVNNAGVWNEEGAFVGIMVLPSFWETWWFRTIAVILFLTTGPSLYFYRFRKLKKEQRRQLEFSRQLLRSQEEERHRIANELHDSLGQNLLVLKNKILLAQKRDGEEQSLEEMSGLVSQTIDEVRSISHNLRPHQLDQLGLTKTLRALLRNVRESSTISFTGEIGDIDGVLAANEEIALFRIVQESLNNIMKHSQATEAFVGATRGTESTTVTIRDNGVGMRVAVEQTREELGGGFGLSGIKARAQMFGWMVSIHSEPGNGTLIELVIPLQKVQ